MFASKGLLSILKIENILLVEVCRTLCFGGQIDLLLLSRHLSEWHFSRNVFDWQNQLIAEGNHHLKHLFWEIWFKCNKQIYLKILLKKLHKLRCKSFIVEALPWQFKFYLTTLFSIYPLQTDSLKFLLLGIASLLMWSVYPEIGKVYKHLLFEDCTYPETFYLILTSTLLP